MWLFKNKKVYQKCGFSKTKKFAVYPAKGSSSTYTIRCICQVGYKFFPISRSNTETFPMHRWVFQQLRKYFQFKLIWP